MAAMVQSSPHSGLSMPNHREEVSTPTTPRQHILLPVQPTPSQVENITVTDPTSNVTAPQPRKPTQSPAPTASQNSAEGQSQLSALAESAVVDDKWSAMDVDGSDNELDGSDNDTENGEPESTSRKKKGQRFFCTGYPPCNLSFTRSEHLARHIRKHTGERPFQCHCSRRFSRLDNLRQHAQTVHVNEEIPTDSLAATGTRFQRQIRTDRVRPTGRPRSGTMSSTGSHSRGHSRNLSASSIGSTSSNFSGTTETRKRPPPLLMASESGSRPRLGLDPPSTPPMQYGGYANDSPGGMSTPTSATYSMTPGSPGFGSAIGSPVSTASRVGAFFNARTPGRRLSVPSGPNPFQPSFTNGYPMSYMGQMPPSNAGTSSNSSVFASPVSTTFSQAAGYQVSSTEDWRRRTWHPSTYPAATFANYSRPATSGLLYSQTPDAPQPAFAQHVTAATRQAPRLPGIESFDHVRHHPSTPPRRQTSPTAVDPALQPPGFVMLDMAAQNQSYNPHRRQGHVSWEASRLPDASSTPLLSGSHRRGSLSWGQQTLNEIHNVAARQQENPAVGDPHLQRRPLVPLHDHQQIAQHALQLQPGLNTGQRQGWRNAAMRGARTSPEDSSSSEGVKTPGISAAEVNPAIVHSNGYIEPQHPVLAAEVQCMPPPSHIPPYSGQRENSRSTFYTDDRTGSQDMGRLAALVAVATSEDKSASAGH